MTDWKPLWTIGDYILYPIAFITMITLVGLFVWSMSNQPKRETREMRIERKLDELLRRYK